MLTLNPCPSSCDAGVKGLMIGLYIHPLSQPVVLKEVEAVVVVELVVVVVVVEVGVVEVEESNMGGSVVKPLFLLVYSYHLTNTNNKLM